MREADIKSLLKDISGPSTRLQTINGWVMCPCPLAPWTHEKRSDAKPSFGVHIEDNDTSIFHCFTCPHKGPVSHFVRLMEGFTGKNHSALIKALENEETYQAELPDWDACTHSVLAAPPEPLHEHFKDLYEPLTIIHPYLKDRGIHSIETVMAAGCAVDDDRGEERIVFPVMDQHGSLYGFTGRATSKNTQIKVKDYLGLPKEHMLLGAHLIREGSERVVIVEGLIDYLIVIQQGHAAVAVMHSGLTEHQADRLADIGKQVCLMYDNDAAGEKGKKEAIKRLSGIVPLSYVDYRSLLQAEDLHEDYELPEDPGSMFPWEIDYLIEQAVMV